MPTSTVKPVSGPLRTRRPERRRCVVFPPMNQFWGNRFPRFTLRARFLVVCALLTLTTASAANAQVLKAQIKVTSLDPGRIRIEAELRTATNVLSFRNTYAGVLGLGERIETLEAIDSSGETVRVQKLAAGEFRADEKFSRLRYEVTVALPARPADMSHVSWLTREHGVLMLADLLPQSTRDSNGLAAALTPVLVSVDVPKRWTVASNTRNLGSQFSTDDPEKAVFLVGSSVHEKRQRLVSTNLSIITSGKWPLSNGDAVKTARRIIDEYSRITRFDLKSNAVVMLIPYPGDAGPENWSAETRGNAVVLLLGRNASRKRVLAKLGIVLSHELFHLWVPNALRLEGDYDWFFEGFTLYQALRTDLRLGFISFDDYLETMARVYASYMSAADGDKLSLLEASERRWTTSSSLVYEKGMLVAFMYDLSLRSHTDCRASLDDVYADLFRLSPTGQRSANETIIKLLEGREGLQSFAKNYVERPAKISLDTTFTPFGIQLQQGTAGAGSTKFVVRRDLSESQRKLLGCIGYRK
jgi:predicted metalloprotease with PDZ domain